MKFRQHIPGFVSGRIKPFEFRFETREELLSHDWMKRWARDTRFHRFSFSHVAHVPVLMCELNGGAEYWVLGYILDAPENALEALGFPPWRAPMTAGAVGAVQ